MQVKATGTIFFVPETKLGGNLQFTTVLPPWKLVYESGEGFFYPSTQRHYHRLILLLILLHVSVVRPSSGRNILLTRITQLTTDPFLEYS
jgi:hypothetical protein